MDNPLLKVRRVPLDMLHPDPASLPHHSPENLAAIERSLRRFGQVEALVVQAGTGRVIAGTGRLMAMRKLRWTECHVVELELDEPTAVALGQALNSTVSLRVWDEREIGRLIEELNVGDPFKGISTGVDEINALLEGGLDGPGPEAP